MDPISAPPGNEPASQEETPAGVSSSPRPDAVLQQRAGEIRRYRIVLAGSVVALISIILLGILVVL